VLEYDRLIIRIEPCAGPRQYQVSVEGEEGEAHGQFDLPFEGRDIENFVLRMSRGRGTRRVETSDSRRAKQFGRELFAAVFQNEVRDVYRGCLADARRQDRGLRALALTKVPELMSVPWEYLYDEPDFLAVSAWTPVVRYLDVARPRAPLAVSPPLRVLGIISDVVDLPGLDVEGERRRLEAALRPPRAQGRVEVHWTQAATLDALLRKLHYGDFHVLHFIGHGAYDETREDGLLLFQGPDEGGHEITGERLGMILQDHRSLRLVVLNACEGARSSQSDPFAGVAASLVQRGIPAVVAMQFEITDDAALTFAAYFYEALAHGDPVDRAVVHARLGIFASGNDVEWGTPVLFLRAADGRLFDLQDEQARSQDAELSLDFEGNPTVAAVGEPISWSLHVQNVGQPSLFRATPRDDAGRPLGEPVDLISGEDAVFTWSSIAKLRVGELCTPLREAGPPDATEAVVFLHGNPGSSADWEPLLAAAGRRWRAVAWDAPGIGRAAAPADFAQSVSAHAQFVGRALDALGLERVHLVAHDFGGPWGLLWAASEPDRFASAVLLGTGALPGYRWHALARLWRTPRAGELFMATATRPGFRLLLRRGNPRDFRGRSSTACTTTSTAPPAAPFSSSTAPSPTSPARANGSPRPCARSTGRRSCSGAATTRTYP
jgi:pimeloyl-ACP methyl ester carboxylesterase